MRQNSSMPTAIILAAGRGRRLGELTSDRPKCLLPVGPRTLLEHQLEALRTLGVRPVVAVVGYHGKAVEALVGERGLCVGNPRHQTTNSLFSLWLVRQYARQGFLLLNSDVLFDPEILRRVLASPYPDAVAVERRSRFDPEEMKVELDADRIRAMSKTLAPERAHAENVGVLKISPEGARGLFERMEELLAAGGEKEFVPYALNAIAATHPLYAVTINGLPWIEIDFAADLQRAQEEIWPAILGRSQQPAGLSLPHSTENTSPALGN